MSHYVDLSQIFEEAIHIENDEQRSQFVDRRCGDDPELKLRVDELLKAFRECEAVLTDSSVYFDQSSLRQLFLADSIERAGIALNPGNGALESEGDQVGPYLLKEKLGVGGFGVVYRALQREPIRREVAIKLVKPGMDSREVLSRFNLERQALALMDHRSIAKIHDAGYTGTGRPYFAMELVNGVPINQYCDENKLSVRRRIRLMIMVCEGIQHAHQKGIIHRDVKPTNILVTQGEDSPTPKLIDFGVAKALDWGGSGDSINTQVGQKIGTPLYMSPEQAKNSSLDVDARADIYSLGAVLFELITGTTPVTREFLSDNADKQIFEVIENVDTPVASRRLVSIADDSNEIVANRASNFSNLVKQVSGELDWIAAKALEPDRERRYGSASELASDLKRYLDCEPVEAAQPSQWYRFTKFARRNQVAFVIAAVIAGLLLASTATSVWYGVKANQSATTAVNAEQEQRKQKEKAIEAEKQQRLEKDKAIEAQRREQQEKQKFEVFFENFDDLLVIATQLDTERRAEMIDELIQGVLDGDQEINGSSLSDFPKLHAQILDGWGKAFNKLELHDRRTALYAKAHRLAKKAIGPKERFTLDILHEHVSSSMKSVFTRAKSKNGPVREELQPDLSKTIKIAEELVEYEQSLPVETSRLAVALEMLSFCHERSGDLENASKVMNRLIQFVENNPNSTYNDRWRAYLNASFLRENQLERIKIYDEVLEMLNTNKADIENRDFNTYLLFTLIFRCKSYIALFRGNEVIDDLRNVVELSKTTTDGGEASFDHAKHRVILAQALYDSERTFESIENYEKSLTIIKRFPKPGLTKRSQRELVICHNRLARCYLDIGQVERARRMAYALPKFADGWIEKDELPALVFQNWRARILAVSGEIEEAQERVQEVADYVQSEACGELNSIGKARILNELADLLTSIGHAESAIQLRMKVLASIGAENDEIAYATKNRLGADYLRAGKLALARDSLNAVLAYYHDRTQGKSDTRSSGQAWFSTAHLAQVHRKMGDFEKASNLLEDLLQQQLNFYGLETRQSVDTRKKLVQVYSARGMEKQALQCLYDIDRAYREMMSRASERWPASWQQFNVANRRFESILELVGHISDEGETEQLLKEAESQILEHYTSLNEMNFSDPDLRKEMLDRSVSNMIKCCELQSKTEEAEKWEAKRNERQQ